MYRTLALFLLLGGPAAAQTYHGALAPGDDQLAQGEYYDQYTVEAAMGQWIEADLTADAFDTYLIVAAPSGAQEDNDDHEGSQRHSHLRVQAQEAGTWRVIVTSYSGEETGDYQLSIAVGGKGPASPPEPSSPAPSTSGGLVGHWYSGSPSAIQYMDPSTGQYAPTSGVGSFLILNADGSYRDGGILRSTTYNCTSEVYVDTQGTYRVSGSTLVLSQSGGRSWGRVCGGEPYQRTLGAETKTFTVEMSGDRLTRYQDGQEYDVMTRGQ